QAGAGNDVLDGGAGNDQLNGGTGDDAYVFGRGSGQDRLVDIGGTGDVIQLASEVTPGDVQVTKSGRDVVLTIAGTNDQLTLAQFFLNPILQVDEVRFADGTVWDAATLASQAQQDIIGTDGVDVLAGTGRDDVLRGLGGDDQISGQTGDDLLDGGAGADTLTGGAGSDAYVVDNPGDVVVEATSEGTDIVQSAVSYTLADHVEQLTLTGTVAINGTGNALDNVLTGNSAANVLTGGTGHDTYVVGAGDTVVEHPNEGVDTVQSDLTYTLGANVESLTLTGNAPINGTGNDLDNMLIGNSSVNILTGGKGNDTYVVGAGDAVIEWAGDGLDTVETNRSYQLGANVENLTLLDASVGHLTVGPAEIGSPYGSLVELHAVGNELGNVLIGNHGRNVLEGGAGNDTLNGGAGDDVLLGGAGEDTYLFGRGSGTDTITDIVAGEVDAIQMAAGVNPDDLVAFRLSFPTQHVFLGVVDAQGSLTGDGLMITYAALDDLLTKEVRFSDGTVWDGATLLAKSAPPVPNPGVTLNGGPGDDTLAGGPGDDQLTGFAGNDQLEGQDGNDTLLGNEGSDVLIGGAGRDTLSGGSPLDPSGNDILLGGAGKDEVSGSGGHDELNGGSENDHLLGWGGNDSLIGGTGHDSLDGGAGEDLLDGGPGDDELFGGQGADTYLFGRGSGHDRVSTNAGESLSEDTIRMAPDVLPADVTIATDGFNVRLQINGTGDHIAAPLSPVQPEFGLGQVVFEEGTVWDSAFLLTAAQFIGTDGSDTFFGTGSTDTFVGGLGDDAYVGVDVVDTVVEGAGEGVDTIGADVDFVLPEYVEHLVLTEMLPGVIGLDPVLRPTLGVGNGEDNVLIGNSADNILDGGAGNDTVIGGFAYETNPDLGDGNDILIGGAGDDVLQSFGGIIGGLILSEELFGTDLLFGGPGNDTHVLRFEDFLNNLAIPDAIVLELPNEGSDTVIVAQDYALDPNVENLTMFGGAHGVGNELDNVLIGSAGVNVLEGGAGRDTLIGGFGQTLLDETIDDGVVDTLMGGTGDDTYIMNVAQDVVVEQPGEGTDTLLALVSSTLGENLENLTLRGAAAIHGTGNLLDNVLTGNDAANVLAGGGGNDQLIGGASDDIYLFNLGDGVDTIRDTAAPGEGNRIRFGAGITQSDLTFSQSGNTLAIQVGTGGDAIQLMDFDPSNVNGSLVVETLELADGSTAGLASLLVPTPTQGDDVLTFGSGDDVIDVLGGNDVVDAGAGNDTITGGTCNDTLTGGAGDDTYVFNLGDGADTINDSAVSGEGNTLVFGPGISPESLSLGLGSLVIRVGTNGDAIHLPNFDPGDAYGPHAIDTFRFADGTVLTYSQLIDRGFDLTGTADGDMVMGTNAVDRIMGLAGNDLLQSNVGDDVLDGGTGVDNLMGGAGNDTYIVDDAGDTVTEAADEGVDTVHSSVTYRLSANMENLALTGDISINGVGNELANMIRGNNTANVLDGDSGADVLIGGTGDDTYLVDNVEDLVTEQMKEGLDTVQSEITYTLGANVENLTLTGIAAITGTGNSLENVLIGNSAANVLAGGAGNDTYIASAGDTIVEQVNEGRDTVLTDVTSTLGANLENLTLTGSLAVEGTGNELDNVLLGNNVANVLDGQVGADTMAGGAGDDVYVVENGNDTVLEAPHEGADTVHSSVTYTLGANIEHLTLTGTAASNGAGNALNNGLIGNGAANVLTGGAGADHLDGGLGADMLIGGTGDDAYVVDHVGDQVTEADNEGVDTVASLITYTLRANVENLTLQGNGALNGTGNALNNMLLGNSGNNMLTGGAGEDRLDGGLGLDTLIGGTGDDTYVVDQIGDVVNEAFNEGLDTMESSITYTLGANSENLILTGSATINGIGNTLNNVLGGNSAANVLDGGAGHDTLDGGHGEDTLTGGSGDDTLIGGAGNDGLDGGSGADALVGGMGTDTITGGSGNDLLDGGDGNDILDAGSGNDTLTGDAGNDRLTGRSGSDLYRFDRGFGQDTIAGSDSGSDTALFGMNPIDLVLSRQANDLRIAAYGSSDAVTIENWYLGNANQTEVIQAGNGERLLNTQVQQLVQAIASFSTDSGLTWEQAIAQRPEDVQMILAANWQ
ncbi:MAG: calcium-binding protein, partial [Nitrospiraceae bacterium]